MRKLCRGTFFVYDDISDDDYLKGGSSDYPTLEEAIIEYNDSFRRVEAGEQLNVRLVVTVYEAARPDDHTEITLAESGEFHPTRTDLF